MSVWIGNSRTHKFRLLATMDLPIMILHVLQTAPKIAQPELCDFLGGKITQFRLSDFYIAPLVNRGWSVFAACGWRR
jgi:hypothetical protein